MAITNSPYLVGSGGSTTPGGSSTPSGIVYSNYVAPQYTKSTIIAPMSYRPSVRLTDVATDNGFITEAANIAQDTTIVYTTMQNSVYLNFSSVTSTSTYYYNYNYDYVTGASDFDKKTSHRNRIRRQLMPTEQPQNAALLACNSNPAELRARGLLREIIGAEEFRNYLRRGFVTVKGRSGMIYRVSGGHNVIYSYVRNSKGKYEKFESICVVFKDGVNLPYSDWVVMRILLVQNDEFALRKVANVSKVGSQLTFVDGGVNQYAIAV